MDAYSFGYNDGWNGYKKDNPFDMVDEYDDWLDYDSGYENGVEDRKS
jgi:ribosome modulation factor